MIKQVMTHNEVLQLLKDGYNMERGWGRSEFWHNKVKHRWREMWLRCYDPTHPRYKDYQDVLISDDFKLFSNYLKWFMNQPNFTEFISSNCSNKWHVDKDIKDPSNRHYFPQYMTLCLAKDNNKERSKEHDYSKSRIPVIGIDIINNTILLFKCPGDAREFDSRFNPTHIRNCYLGKRKSHCGYKWYYLDMNDRR